MLEMDHGDRHEAQSSKYRSTGVSKEIYIHTEYKGSTSTIHKAKRHSFKLEGHYSVFYDPEPNPFDPS